jgi:hypothetical protein
MTADEMRDKCDYLRLAACDPDGPLYGSDLVPVIDDLTTFWRSALPTAEQAMKERCARLAEFMGSPADGAEIAAAIRALE